MQISVDFIYVACDWWPQRYSLHATGGHSVRRQETRGVILFYTKLSILMFYIIGIGQNVDIYPFKTALEAVGNVNPPKFFKANFIPLKLS
jgi:hypothetical protein